MTSPNSTAKNAAGVAKKYARDVIEGRIIAGKYARLACERFERDLARTDWDFELDEKKAAKAVKFEELMPHVKGRWASKRETLQLQPWQVFIEVNLFGWVHRETRLRRFRESYEEVPRKNGKSTRMAARALFLFAADGEAGAEVYSGATSEKQAHEIFAPAWHMARALQRMREHFEIEQAGNPKNPGPMYRVRDMSKFETMIGKPGDGSSPHAAMVDEYHEHDSDHMVDAMQTGMGAREQPLLSIITTAGTNLGGPCFEKRRDVMRILEQTVTDETIFGIIYGVDETDKWDDPASLKKANPNYGVSVFEPFLLAQLTQARRSASKQNAYRTKHLNQWVGAKSLWMNILAWHRQRRPATLDQFKGCRAWVANDLASKKDVAAVVPLIEMNDGNLIAIPTFFVPESALEDSPKYRDFVTAGTMIATPGSMTDYAFIEEHLKSLSSALDVQEFIFDDWQANYLMTRMAGLSVKVVDFNQTVRNLSDPMKEVEGRILARTLWHDGNSVMDWMMGNVAAKLDAKENIYPRKENENDPNCKIDGPVALIMAMGRFLTAETSGDMDGFFARPVIA